MPAEELADCVIAPPMKNFRFEPDLAWPEEPVMIPDEPEIIIKKPKKRVHKVEESEDESDEDEIPKPFASQFKMKKRRLD